MDAALAIERDVEARAARAAAQLNTKNRIEAARLASHLKATNAKVVFELLQYADDCNYGKARRGGQDPAISFDLFKDRLVVQYNEDGFDTKDKKALCNGTITKSSVVGYIGDRLLGFKSVFKVARKVTIQSGSMSFSLEDSDDTCGSGLGMMVPVDEPIPTNGQNIGTTLTLELRQRLWFGKRGVEYAELAHQLGLVRHETLLFTKNIQTIVVRRYDEQGLIDNPHSSKFSLDGLAPLEVVTKQDLAEQTKEVKRYYVFSTLCSGVPRSETRIYSEEDEVCQPDKVAEVILAFPVNADLTPQVELHHPFSFFPIDFPRFKFVIQADFVTGEGIMNDSISLNSRRNRALFSAVLSCFRRATRYFPQHPVLQYHWVKWLPDTNRTTTVGWSEVGHMRSYVQSENSRPFKTRSGAFTSLQNLRKLPDWLLDDDGEPLWRDIAPERYPAAGYDADSLARLSEYGLQAMDVAECLDRVQADLNTESGPSRYMDILTSESWHDRSALCLSNIFDMAKALPTDALLSRLKSLKLVPLQGDIWAAAGSFPPVYFPHTGGVLIPQGLRLQLVAPYAVNNVARVQLFKKLGVKKPPVRLVRDLISRTFGPCYWHLLPSSVSHLRFMYLTHGSLTREEAQKEKEYFGRCRIYNRGMRLTTPHTDTVYMPGTGAYCPSQLLGTDFSSLSELSVSFIHDSYLADAPTLHVPGHVSWEEWLCQTLSVRTSIRIGAKDGKLSPEFQHVARNRPGDIVYLLRDIFKKQTGELPLSPDIVIEIASLPASCERGRTVPLSETYLPLPRLTDIAKETLGEDYASEMNILFLEQGCAKIETDFGFLGEHFSVGMTDDLDFYVDLLDAVLNCAPDAKDYSRPWESLLSIYIGMQKRLDEFSDPTELYLRLNDHYRGKNFIFVPAIDDASSVWISSIQCRWHAPVQLRANVPLKHLYEKALEKSPFRGQMDWLESFFEGVLENPDVTWEDFISELRYMREAAGNDQLGWCTEIYEALDEDRIALLETAKEEEKRVSIFAKNLLATRRTTLRSEDLVYLPNGDGNCWYKPAECLWSTNPNFRGSNNIASHYPRLEPFFVEFLGVPRATVQTLCDELKKKATGNASATEMKGIFLNLSDMLTGGGQSISLGDRVQGSILLGPDPDDHVKLGAATAKVARARVTTPDRPAPRTTDEHGGGAGTVREDESSSGSESGGGTPQRTSPGTPMTSPGSSPSKCRTSSSSMRHGRPLRNDEASAPNLASLDLMESRSQLPPQHSKSAGGLDQPSEMRVDNNRVKCLDDAITAAQNMETPADSAFSVSALADALPLKDARNPSKV